MSDRCYCDGGQCHNPIGCWETRLMDLGEIEERNEYERREEIRLASSAAAVEWIKPTNADAIIPLTLNNVKYRAVAA